MSTIVQVQYHYRTGLNCWKGLVMFIVIIISFHFYTFWKSTSMLLCFSLSLKKANWNGLSLGILTHMVLSWEVQHLLSYSQFTMPAHQNHDFNHQSCLFWHLNSIKSENSHLASGTCHNWLSYMYLDFE